VADGPGVDAPVGNEPPPRGTAGPHLRPPKWPNPPIGPGIGSVRRRAWSPAAIQVRSAAAMHEAHSPGQHRTTTRPPPPLIGRTITPRDFILITPHGEKSTHQAIGPF